MNENLVFATQTHRQLVLDGSAAQEDVAAARTPQQPFEARDLVAVDDARHEPVGVGGWNE